jgi:hypothetical protein
MCMAPLSKSAQHSLDCPCLVCKRKRELGNTIWETILALHLADITDNGPRIKGLFKKLEGAKLEYDCL